MLLSPNPIHHILSYPTLPLRLTTLVRVQALSESRSEHVNSILTLDENLAIEQQTRVEQQRVVAELQVCPARHAKGEMQAF